MVKRFTETTKWNDPWYRKLPIKHKILWQYLCDNCDNAGVWKIDFELVSFYIGEEITHQDIEGLNSGKDRVIVVNDKNLVIKDFISFQIGDINHKQLTNLQKNCISLIQKHLSNSVDIVKITNLTGSLRVAYKYKHKGKGKGKGKDISKDKGKAEIDFIESLRTNPIYSHINFDVELGKMDVWLTLHKGRQKTKKFVVNWLNKIEKPLPTEKAKSAQPIYKAPNPKGKFQFVPEVNTLLKDLVNKGVNKPSQFKKP